MSSRSLFLALGAVLACGSALQAQDARQLAVHARSFLKQYCHRCHNSDDSYYNALALKAVPEKKKGSANYLVAKKPEDSSIWQRIDDKEMPPRNEREQPTDAEKALFRKWIEAGAPDVPIKDQGWKFVGQAEMLDAIVKDLDAADRNTRPHLRYFTLTHLHNNPTIPDDDMRIYRAGLSKALNSLSWKPNIVRPTPIGPFDTVFRIDLRSYGWEKPQLWRAILKEYPYGLHWRNNADPALDKLDEKLKQLQPDCDLAVLRADWFIVNATRPPLYHTLLELPKHAHDLEMMLKVDVNKNILNGTAGRGGFMTSGVSGQNRLVERHIAANGAYWKSYDFKIGKGNGNLARFPLGPKFKGNPHDRQAFEHDGGEMIFNLPNGLQAYLLVDGKDNRIDEGPIAVVSDSLKTSGTPAIVTGLSCMACHKNGMIPFKDQIREGTAVVGEPLRAVRNLYPEHAKMDEWLKQDEKKFMDALEEASGKFLRGSATFKDKPLREFAEPISEVARLHRLIDLDASMVAAELWLSDGATGLQAIIKVDGELVRLGLKPLLQINGAIKRHDWESTFEGTSVYQEVARRLKVGTPLLP